MADLSNKGVQEADCNCGVECKCKDCKCGEKCSCNPQVKQDMTAFQSVLPPSVQKDLPLSGSALEGTCTVTPTFTEPGQTDATTVQSGKNAMHLTTNVQ